MQHEHHRVPVTALALFRSNVIIAGEGNYLKAYAADSRLLSSTRIFPDQAIHGIVVDEESPATAFIYGGQLIRPVFVNNCDHNIIELDLGTVQDVGDWILDARFAPAIEDSSCRYASILTAHNALYLVCFDPKAADGSGPTDSARIECIVSRSNCILYSAHLRWLNASQCLVASGTAFGDVIVWSAFLSNDDGRFNAHTQTHYTFSAHEGSIFGVQLSSLVRLLGSHKEKIVLASCSDDRNVKLWDISDLTTESPTLAEMQRVTGFGTSDQKLDVAPPCLAKVMGHVSRIWQVRFVIQRDSELQNIHSFGEDASVITWRLAQASGHLGLTLEKTDVTVAHSGKNIWAVAVDAFGQLATGGADGSIALYSATPSIAQDVQIPNLLINGSTSKDKLRAYGFVDTGSIVSTTDRGAIVDIHFNQNGGAEKTDVLIHPISCLQGFSIIATASGVAFIGGAKGDIYGYVKGSNRVEHITKGDRKPAGLFASQIDREKALLITTVGSSTARLLLRKLDLDDGRLDIIRQMELDLPMNFIVTSCALQTVLSSSCAIIGSRTGSIAIFDLEHGTDSTPLKSVRLHHSAHGKEAITHLETFMEDPLSKESWLFSCGRDGTFAVHQLFVRDKIFELKLVHQLSLPFGPNIEGMSLCKKSSLLVWGFKSTNFIVYDVVAQRETMSVECGGAHRNWAFQPNRAGDTFIWTKASSVYRMTQTRLQYELLNAGGHGREIKCVAISPSKPQVIATGAEDTDIKLHRYEGGKFRCLQTLRKHNTGIQCLQWSKDGRYLFSSGGFEEFHVWKVSNGIPYIDVGVVCESKHPRSGLSDLRIMGFDVRDVNGGETDAFKVLTAYSDSTAKLWNYSADSWELLANGDYLTACLTHAIWASEAEIDFVVAATDGHLTIWKVNETEKALLWDVRFKVHQNAIHVTAPRKLSDGTTIVVTGGDDNAIGVTRFASTSVAAAARTMFIPRAHAAAVTGIVIVALTDASYWLLSAGIDQRLKRWQLDIDASKPGIDGVNVKLLQDVFTAVADVASLDLCTLEDGSLGVLVSGVGMDVWRLPPMPENCGLVR